MSIIDHREYAHDPLHDPRQRFPRSRADQKVIMIAHHTEILDPESVALPGSANHLQERILHACFIQNELLAVDPS